MNGFILTFNFRNIFVHIYIFVFASSLYNVNMLTDHHNLSSSTVIVQWLIIIYR